ncbi:hypothetical protein IX332_001783 [Porphyromonas levii]|uniref:FimB/Mfa2 family fimbrial subunit n=1 Tax=Porphyromonas levii TaxID=28114 RepID=UPI001B8B73F0|nr:FimB/Mfa2 family fimbrial subunit [Porphyromonas levii]MBR8730439.1 hypothetical protein [Porphyromonas levii]
MRKRELYMRLLVGLALLSLLGLASCTKQDDVPESGTDVYMSFQMSQVASGSGVRAQGSSPSINTDEKDREDFVSRFGVFIFETGASGTKVAEKFSDQAFFVMKFKKGTYDFYFIANYPTSDETRLSQMSKSQLEEYLKAPKPYTLHNVPSEAGPFFPMARVYRNQTISGNGTMMAPIPFKPRVGTTNQLMPVSSFGNDYQSKTTQETVNLVRACAKLSFTLSGNGVQDIDSVKYHNVAADYTFMETPDRNYNSGTVQELVFTKDASNPANPITAKVYVPERLFKSGTSWADHTTNGINFITITMKSGKEYEIPVITNDKISGSYMDFAIGTGANYSVIRNHHYMYNIKVPEDNKELDVQFQVMPWNLVESEMSYARPSYELEITQGGQTFKKIKEEVILHDDASYKPTSAKIRFKIIAPKGALWTATITNGRDFILSGDVAGLINEGIVTGEGEWHEMIITPRYSFDKEPRYTQFYITVEGKEIYLGYDDKGVMINRFIGDGSADKWQFKQERTILQGSGN